MSSKQPVRMMRRVLTIAVLAALSTSCALWQKAEPTHTSPAAAAVSDAVPDNGALIRNVDLIAVDLVNALSQVNGMHPSEATIEMQTPATHFGDALKSVLEQAGYALRIVKDEEQAKSTLLSHAVTELETEGNGIRNSYQIVVGEIRLKREYFEQPYGVSPSSNMYVIGADPERITLNDELFEIASTRTTQVASQQIGQNPDQSPDQETVTLDPPKVVPVALASDPPEPDTPIAVVPSLVDDDLSAGEQPAGNEVQTYPTQALSAPRSTQAETSPAPLIKKNEAVLQVKLKGNMYELGRSNFSAALDNFSDMKKDVLVFGNDSLRLGHKNKEALTSFINDFQEDSDVISVIGCSHGRTNLNNGNALLATGRAQRVKEALLFAGIPEDRILEEGCWAPRHFDEMMPRRGVVITHKREDRNG